MEKLESNVTWCGSVHLELLSKIWWANHQVKWIHFKINRFSFTIHPKDLRYQILHFSPGVKELVRDTQSISSWVLFSSWGPYSFTTPSIPLALKYLDLWSFWKNNKLMFWHWRDMFHFTVILMYPAIMKWSSFLKIKELSNSTRNSLAKQY